jgi:hypothetical protein
LLQSLKNAKLKKRGTTDFADYTDLIATVREEDEMSEYRIQDPESRRNGTADGRR